MFKITPLISAAALLLGASAAANAASVHITDFSAAEYAALTQNGVGSDFEADGADMGEGEVGRGLSNDVGFFTTIGGQGTGGTVNNLPGNTGNQIALRDGNVFGRSNQVPLGGSWYLDSNDTHGIVWSVNTGQMFNMVTFAITDAAEFGSVLRVLTGGAEAFLGTEGRERNGAVSLVTILFDEMISDATIEIGHFASTSATAPRTNDGFSIDGAFAGIAPVPLPASLPMLALGAGGLVLLRRRAKKTS